MPRVAMKTALIDNSLCVLTIRDDAAPSDIAAYIRALASAGVKYVEIDFRALMKLRCLPEGAGYIFRPVDPMFLRLTELFDFDYICVGVREAIKYPKFSGSVMFTLPESDYIRNKAVPCNILKSAQCCFDGKITAMRMCGDLPLLSYAQAEEYVSLLKRNTVVPVDICPANNCKTALNSAIGFINSNADSVTVTMGSSEKYCSLEELMITFLALYGNVPLGMNMSGLCDAAVLHTRIFKNSSIENIPDLVRLLENDQRLLINADTGDKVSAAAKPPSERRFFKAFADFLKGIKCDWDIRDDDTVPREVVESFTAGLYNSEADDMKKIYGGYHPFLN